MLCWPPPLFFKGKCSTPLIFFWVSFLPLFLQLRRQGVDAGEVSLCLLLFTHLPVGCHIEQVHPPAGQWVIVLKGGKQERQWRTFPKSQMYRIKTFSIYFSLIKHAWNETGLSESNIKELCKLHNIIWSNECINIPKIFLAYYWLNDWLCASCHFLFLNHFKPYICAHSYSFCKQCMKGRVCQELQQKCFK